MILGSHDAGARMAGAGAASVLRPARLDSLRKEIVSSRVNRSGVGDDDPALIESLQTA
jgi:hypothetical protein